MYGVTASYEGMAAYGSTKTITIGNVDFLFLRVGLKMLLANEITLYSWIESCMA